MSTGQIFMPETLQREILALEPYVGHTEIERVENVDDGIYSNESASELYPHAPVDEVGGYRIGEVRLLMCV